MAGSPFSATAGGGPGAILGPNGKGTSSNTGSGTSVAPAVIPYLPGQQPSASPFVSPNYLGPNNYVPNDNSTSPFYDSTKQPYGYGANQDQGPLVNQPTAPMDPYQALLQELTAMNSGGPSTADLQKQAQQQAALKYDPLIQQLQQNLGTAKTNEGVASQKVGDIYNSLGRALAAQIPVITNQYANAENQSQQNYQTLLSQIQQNYQGAQQQQAAELQKLGIEAALPQSTEKLNRDQQYLMGQAQTNGQALNDAMRLMGQGQADFAQRASLIAPQQGANTQADLAQKLLQLENQTNQQIAGYKGQEAADAASLLAQLQNQAATNSQKSQMDAIDSAMKLAQFNDFTHPGIYGVKPSSTPTTYKGQSGVAKFIADNVTDPQHAALLQGAFNDFYNSKDNAGLTGPGGVGTPALPMQLQALADYERKNNPTMPTNDLQMLNTLLAIMNGKYQ